MEYGDGRTITIETGKVAKQADGYAFGGRRMSSSARGTGFSAMQERLFGQTEEALWGHETGFSVTGEGSGKCLKMGKRGCEKAETGRL